MDKYLNVIFLVLIFITGCARHNQINFSSREDFISSLNEKETINNASNEKVAKSSILKLSSYEIILTQKFDFDEYLILKTFNNPSFIIKHGKVKNLQYHLKFCHLDLFFLDENETYKFKHFDIRPSAIQSNLNKRKCVEELNNKFTLIHDPK